MDFQSDIDKCLATLQQGGTILYPTDTVWGLGCDATNQEAVEKLLETKNRTAFQGLIMIVKNVDDVLKYCENDVEEEKIEASISSFLQTTTKPTTVIYAKGKDVASSVLNADGSIAMRIPQDVFCKQLLQQFGKPIVSTSANIHGEPTPGFFSEVSQAVKSKVDYIVEYRREDVTPRQSSSLVRWLGYGKVEIIRP